MDKVFSSEPWIDKVKTSLITGGFTVIFSQKNQIKIPIDNIPFEIKYDLILCE